MELNRVIIVYKKTLHKLRNNNVKPCTCRRVPATSSVRYAEALDMLASLLERMHIRARFTERSRLTRAHKADLLLCLGGDGTVLSAAHAANDTPILGVNFMPATSVGFFCAADLTNVERIMREIVQDRRRPTRVPLLAVDIGGRRLRTKALNDVLFASPSPAEMSRYTIETGGRTEAQRSSGVWIAAGPGSTAAISSAGGVRRPLTSPRLQYLVREPCPLPGKRYRLTHGVLRTGAKAVIRSDMSNAFAYLDGPDLMYPVPRGCALTVTAVPKALKIFL